MMRWFALRETRVVESDDPVNIRYVDGRLESLTSEAAALAQWVSTPLDCVSGGVLRSALERSFVAVLGDREINRQNFPLSRGMTSFDRSGRRVLRSALIAHLDLGNGDPSFSGNGIEQIHSPVLFEDGRIPQLIHLPVGGAAH